MSTYGYTKRLAASLQAFWYHGHMIRTRDFLLFVTALVFLIMVVFYTVQTKDQGALSVSDEVDFSAAEVQDITISGVPKNDSRADRLADLQKKIAAGEGQLISAPPVFTSVDSPDTVSFDESVVSTGTVASISPVQYCGNAIPHIKTNDWPNQPRLAVAIDVSVQFDTQLIQKVGSSTQSVLVTDVYTTLPIRTIRSNFDSCLPDTTIGVTTNGLPLLNTDAWQYQAVPGGVKIGFARDGFGIYGPITPKEELDDCGGQYVNGTYQYHVSNTENIISCFAGIPVDL